MRLVFWLNMLSHHQAAHVRGLVALGHDVTLVADRVLSEDRRRMGWSAGDFGTTNTIIDPSLKQIEAIVKESGADGIHIIGGYRGYRIGRLAMEVCFRHKSRVGLMAESGVRAGLKGAARLGVWRYDWIRSGRRLDFVLGMGRMGEEWFNDCGYHPKKVFRYGYFVVPWGGVQPGSGITSTDRVFRISFVGQCHHRKGIDLALHALSLIQHTSWEFTVLGDGPARGDLEALASRLGIARKVVFRPFVPVEEVYMLLNHSHLMVLPSRFDGWGVVINEALHTGVPVVCTDRCGASDLLEEPWRGTVVKTSSVANLAVALEQRVAQGPISLDERRRIMNWSNCITGLSAARYLAAVLDHVYGSVPRPVPPWSSVQSEAIIGAC